ncbi:MAG: hypothetical protein WC975_13960 [Phycisphaerae bacterium]
MQTESCGGSNDDICWVAGPSVPRVPLPRNDPLSGLDQRTLKKNFVLGNTPISFKPPTLLCEGSLTESPGGRGKLKVGHTMVLHKQIRLQFQHKSLETILSLLVCIQSIHSV